MSEEVKMGNNISGAELFDFLCNALNEQGYLLQEACVKAIEDNKKYMGWKFQTQEYPVSLRDRDTRVDIVLHWEGSQRSDSPDLYALLECKRAHPSYVCWLFGSPNLAPDRGSCLALGFRKQFRSGTLSSELVPFIDKIEFSISTYRVTSWYEVSQTKAAKRERKDKISTPQNIEDAFSQVLRGVGGFAQEQRKLRMDAKDESSAFFIPVVVTTAPIYVAGYRPEDIYLGSGTLAKNKVSLGEPPQQPDEEKYVLADYGAGESVSPEDIPYPARTIDPGKLLKEFKRRCIFIVNSKNVVEFLKKLTPPWLPSES